jgi:hypothetical protein
MFDTYLMQCKHHDASLDHENSQKSTSNLNICEQLKTLLHGECNSDILDDPCELVTRTLSSILLHIGLFVVQSRVGSSLGYSFGGHPAGSPPVGRYGSGTPAVHIFAGMNPYQSSNQHLATTGRHQSRDRKFPQMNLARV